MRTRITDPIVIGSASATRMTAGRVDAGTIPGRSRKVNRSAAVPGTRSAGIRRPNTYRKPRHPKGE